MKVVHISTLDSGGAGIACNRLHSALLKEGVDSVLLTARKSINDIPSHYTLNEQSLNLVSRIKRRLGTHRFEWEKHRIKIAGQEKGHEAFSSAFSDYDVLSSRAVEEADIINLHWTAGFWDYRSFGKTSKPIVWTLHDMYPFTGGCHYSEGCTKYLELCTNCPQLKGTENYNYSAILHKEKIKKVQGSRLHVVALSSWLADCARKSRVLNSFPVSLIRNSIDMDSFYVIERKTAREKLGIPANTKVLLFVSQNLENKRKGLALLMEAIAGWEDENICIVSIGNTSSRSNNANVHHISLGEVNDESTMALAYNAADAFVIPSIEDNLPNVMLESLACGTPVIGFAVGGMKDIISNLNGVLAEEVSSHSLKDAIVKFFDKMPSFKRDEIRKYAENTFSSKKQALEYINIYRELLAPVHK